MTKRDDEINLQFTIIAEASTVGCLQEMSPMRSACVSETFDVPCPSCGKLYKLSFADFVLLFGLRSQKAAELVTYVYCGCAETSLGDTEMVRLAKMLTKNQAPNTLSRLFNGSTPLSAMYLRSRGPGP